MPLRMLLKPSLFPFLRVRAGNSMQQRRNHGGGAKSPGNARGGVSTKGRRFAP